MKKSHVIVLIVLILAIAIGAGPLLRYLCQRWKSHADRAVGRADFEKAEKILKRLLKICPEKGETFSKLARISFRQKRYSEALQYTNRAIKEEPKNPHYYRLKGNILLMMGKKEQGIKALKMALKLAPDTHELRRNLAKLLWELKRTDEAVSLLEEVTVKNLEDPDSFVVLYNILNESGKKKKAIEVMETSLQLKKPPLQSFSILLEHYREKEQSGKIDMLLNTFLKKYAGNIETYQAVGSYYEDVGKLKRTEEILKRAKEVLPDKIHAYFMLADFYRRHERYSEALEVAEEALSIEPNSSQLYYLLGIINYDMGKLKRAEKELKRSIAIRHKQPISLNMLAWLYLTAQPGSPLYQPEEALSLARKAVALDPDNSAYIDTLARASYVNKLYDEAIINYKKNLAANSTLEYAYYGLAACYYRKGDVEKGNQMLEKALELKFSDEKLIVHDADIPQIRNNKKIKEILRQEQNGNK